MRRFIVVLSVVAVLLGMSATAKADPVMYFALDDFVQTFAVPGNPGSAGTTFTSDGRLVYWDTGLTAGWFKLQATSLGALSVGTEWVTDYNNVVLDIYTNPNFTGLIWAGNGGALTTHVQQAGGLNPLPPYEYLASSYPRPADYTDPTYFQSVGSGYFTGANTGAGFNSATKLFMPWFGTYAWTYDAAMTYQTGNLQGEVSVPEPGSMLLLGTGLFGLAGAIRRRIRK